MTEAWSPSVGAPGPAGRDPRLALFASGGTLDGAVPSGRVLGTLESLAAPSGSGGTPFAGSTHDEDAGMLAAVTAVESHAGALKLALVRQIIRRHAPAGPGGPIPGPDAWDEDLPHDVAAILRISWQATAAVIDLAWQLEARLPGVNGLLNRGVCRTGRRRSSPMSSPSWTAIRCARPRKCCWPTTWVPTT